MMSATFDRPVESEDKGQAGTDTVDRTFATGSTCRLSLDNTRGRVRVTAWDRPEVHLVATKRLDASRARYLATSVVTRHDGDAVEIQTVLDPSESYSDRLGLTGVAAEVIRGFTELLGSLGSTAEVDYDLHVPAQATINLKGVSAEFAVDGTNGALKVRSVSGTIDTRLVSGSLDVGSVSGAIDLRGVDGETRAESVSGAVHVEGQIASLRAKTVSGEIEVSGPLDTNGSIELGSVSGAASLELPASTKATISLRGLSSDVHCELPVAVDRDRRGPGSREWTGRLNGGGSAISFRTVSGSLNLRGLPNGFATTRPEAPPPASGTPETSGIPVEPLDSDGGPAAAPSTDPAPPSDDAGAMQILQALERGELTVDEALRQIDALRSRNA